jgi:LPS O-antigen subunit length determinant protein (WzzB/FepE family)
MIIALTLLLTVAAAGICFILPNVYEVTTILEPGKDAEGKLVENSQVARTS